MTNFHDLSRVAVTTGDLGPLVRISNELATKARAAIEAVPGHKPWREPATGQATFYDINGNPCATVQLRFDNR